jgi:acyl-CoA reductase-like NAD-dependent aldehyde dehydrogenase
MSVESITTISPVTNKPILTRNGLSESELAALPAVATEAFQSWRKTSLQQRQSIVERALDLLEKQQDELAGELTEQMGRPIAYTAKEITTAVARGRYLLKISDDALSDTPGEVEKGFKRYIKKVPLGPVLILFAWNVSLLPFPYIPSAPTFPAVPNIPYLSNKKKVSVSDSGEFNRSCIAVWEHCHIETIPSNSDNCRAYSRNILEGWIA